jgi:hypothetical protein
MRGAAIFDIVLKSIDKKSLVRISFLDFGNPAVHGELQCITMQIRLLNANILIECHRSIPLITERKASVVLITRSAPTPGSFTGVIEMP